MNGNAIARVFRSPDAAAIYLSSKATKILEKVPHNFEANWHSNKILSLVIVQCISYDF